MLKIKERAEYINIALIAFYRKENSRTKAINRSGKVNEKMELRLQNQNTRSTLYCKVKEVFDYL